mgnify:CR=1 FL=1
MKTDCGKGNPFKRLINIGLSMICLLLEISLFAYMWQFHFQFQLVDPPAEDLVSWLSAGKRYLQCNPDIFLRDLRRHASGIHENTEIIFSQVFATLMADVLIYAELCMMARSTFSGGYVPVDGTFYRS